MSQARGIFGHIENNFMISRLIIGGFCVAVCVAWILSSIALGIGYRTLFGEHAYYGTIGGGGGTFVHSGGRTYQFGRNATPECRADVKQCKPFDDRKPTIWEMIVDGAQMAVQNMHIPILGVLAWLGVFWFQHGLMLSWATGAVTASRGMEKRLYNIVENQSIQLGQPMPKLEIIESGAMNAFAYGLSPEEGTIVVTRGLMNGLSDNELATVIAHEYTHILNGDSCVMLVAAVFVGVFENTFHHILSGITGAHEKSSAAWVANLPGRILIGAFIFAPLCLAIAICWVPSMLGRAKLSRSRELLADAGAVEITKDPDALVSALLKIGQAETTVVGPPTLQAMMIFGEIDGLLSTHPTIEERIAALKAYAGARMPVKRVRLASAAAPGFGPHPSAFGRRVGDQRGPVKKFGTGGR